MQSSILLRLLVTFIFPAEIFAASAQNTAASPPPGANILKGKALAIFAPAPRYPPDAQGRRPSGRGVVVVEVDKTTGWVTSAKMEKSTGYKILDAAALEAFSRWRFMPGTNHKVRLPITFNNRQHP
jgi:TonB family protein